MKLNEGKSYILAVFSIIVENVVCIDPTTLLMILVDDAGGAHARIDHSPWNGCTLADFVMPFFLFIVGVAIALTFKGSLVGLKNVAKPTNSNAASADSIRSCKTEPSGCFTRQISNLSFYGVTGESSVGDNQDCCASSMLLMGEQPPRCSQGSESSFASDIRNSTVQRYKEKKKTRKPRNRMQQILVNPGKSQRRIGH